MPARLPYALLVACFLLVSQEYLAAAELDWTGREFRILQSMLLPTRDDLPPAKSNRFADNSDAAELGRLIFFDRRFSGDGEISCASCHQPEKYYTDGLARSRGAGEAMRNAPTIVGAAFHRWFYWDGRRDSLWSQALVPFEALDEMGSSRLAVLRHIASDQGYRTRFESIFGPIPDGITNTSLPEHAAPYGSSTTRKNWYELPRKFRTDISAQFANVGKSIAAFERTLLPPETRFDSYVRALTSDELQESQSTWTADEEAGARLFMDTQKTQCLQCHNGPLLTNGDFHNIGTGNFSGEMMDYGRMFGLRSVLMDEYNCIGPFSDADPRACVSLRFINTDAHVPLEGAFKVPGLRGLAATAPYFHDGRFDSLTAVLEYYNDPPALGTHELRALALTKRELAQIEKFLLLFAH